MNKAAEISSVSHGRFFMNRHLTKFEELARRLVEGSFARLFGDRLEAAEVAARLAQAIEREKEGVHAPDLYDVVLHPEDYADVLQATPEVEENLAAYVIRLAEQANMRLAERPFVRLQEDPTVPRRQVWIKASFSRVAEASTQLHEVPQPTDAPTALRALDAFLILDGKRHVPLRRPIINLGRRTDNDVVLDASSVSRRHAQLRWRYGRYILYDLSGRGRTFVNGEPVTECVLQPGDVIGLSDALIIYGEGQDDRHRLIAADDDLEETRLLP